MPVYEYICHRCNEWMERFQHRIGEEMHHCPKCRRKMRRIPSVPQLGIWNPERKFPNLSTNGDGSMTFPSQAAYKKHLEDNGIHEVGITAPIKKPHGNKTVGRWK